MRRAVTTGEEEVCAERVCLQLLPTHLAASSGEKEYIGLRADSAFLRVGSVEWLGSTVWVPEV
jgi:hypothetical protein